MCQFCKSNVKESELTIDHLVPLSLGGLDEPTNYITACASCNHRKGAMPLTEFLATLSIELRDLPVHGDPVIDNATLPIQLRLLRKQIYDRHRSGVLSLSSKRAQQKLEKEYRRALWPTPKGQDLARAMPELPGHVRVIVPEIDTIARTQKERSLLIELAKSANTRNLLGTVLKPGMDIEAQVRRLAASTSDAALKKRLPQAIRRWERVRRKDEPKD